jgi:hypothetical protein
MKKYINTTWEIWDYDTWGNARDGYVVNDRHCYNRAYPIRLAVAVNNQGTDMEFESAYPTDKQIKEAFGLGKAAITTSGDDLVIYVSRECDDCPIGEMICTSHDSLSPIRERE